MAYPTGTNFQQVGPVGGLQPIGESSTVQRHPVGTVATARDLTYGIIECVYLLGLADTAPGDFCFYNSLTGVTVRSVHGGTGSNGPACVAMSANLAGQYGWYATLGTVPVKSGTVADNGALYLTATEGQVDDARVGGDLIDGMTAKAATSAGFTTCLLNRPNVSGLTPATGVTDTLLYCTLSAATENSQAIVVTGQIKTLDGTNVTSAKEVIVRSLAVTDDKGDITVTTGTGNKIVNPATGENVAWITTTAGGAFACSIANDVAEINLFSAHTQNGLITVLKLTFT